jgi:hypothetical protein
MPDLPEPMTPADCDLRGYDFMPLFGHRLFGSVFEAHASDAEFRSALRLWWQAWQQCPAGSLPNDDVALSRLADFGRDIRAWLKVKARALHGFTLCTDGRLYHPLLCEQAKLAFERRRKERDRKAEARSAKRKVGAPSEERPRPEAGDAGGTDAEHPGDVPGMSHGTGGGQVADVPANRREQERTGQTEEPSLRSGRGEGRVVEAAALFAGPAEPPPDARTALFREGLARIRRLTGQPDAKARSLLGRLLRDCADDAAALSLVLAECEALRPADPVAWLTQAVRARGGQRPATAARGGHADLSWMEQPGAVESLIR